MARGFNLLISPTADAADPHVQRFELDVESAAPGRPWRATLWIRGGRHQLSFDSPSELSRTLAQLTQHSAEPRARSGLF
jgi:hypothetical protein